MQHRAHFSSTETKRHPTLAFSLVELSIVLVILGLLVGGVLGGQSLIKAAQLRSVTTELNKFQTAINAFQVKYNALPGDLVNATSYWTADSTAACTGGGVSLDRTAGVAETCNGNGDGLVDFNGINEWWKVWQHLANAGLVEGTYSGVGKAGSINQRIYECDPGVTCPKSRFPGAVWTLSYWAPITAPSTAYFDLNPKHVLEVAAARSGNWSSGAALSGQDAWNIDQKADDGKPQSGMMIQRKANGSNVTCATTGDPATAVYSTSETAMCGIMIKTGF